jgi:hypothetical protein
MLTKKNSKDHRAFSSRKVVEVEMSSNESDSPSSYSESKRLSGLDWSHILGTHTNSAPINSGNHTIINNTATLKLTIGHL